MADFIFKLDVDTKDLFKMYTGLEKTIYQGIPKFFIEELDFNLQFNVPVVTGQLKRSLKFYRKQARKGNNKIADFEMMWYGIPVEERRGFLARSMRETYSKNNRILTNAIAYGMGGRL